MAETSYQRSVVTDFTGLIESVPNFSLLQSEIANCAISSAAITHINASGDAVYIWFNDPLTVGDESILDGLIAAHTGEKDTNKTQYNTNENEQSTTSTDWQQAVGKQCGALSEGLFLIEWYCEAKLGNGALGDDGRLRAAYGGNALADMIITETEYVPFSGMALIDSLLGNKPLARIRYKIYGSGGDEIFVQRARIMVSGLEVS